MSTLLAVTESPATTPLTDGPFGLPQKLNEKLTAWFGVIVVVPLLTCCAAKPVWLSTPPPALLWMALSANRFDGVVKPEAMKSGSVKVASKRTPGPALLRMMLPTTWA